ncbi:GNAT family N-acetyltransferase [Actinosynnema sp. NPDC047251]|uniref:Transcriptional regulator, ArsR family n=1 Tax=Saccharothrix espanaensis (strain ATCC 51144 / DSM 44229 / JCM 9112 / NBRC 15066 / NRRL 15764) TaxID=1179773 RepID=K0K8H8_SACES|nr:GNAT family N-acetyltransferase [Saccharothrix espanaensis]CCH33119.1 Transcriptional regulator, ArsR family [Saccharothrix espanaensis DSM 44229]
MTLTVDDAQRYADRFACLADPTRVRLLHIVATHGGEIAVGALADGLGVSQSTCSHHVRRLAGVGFLRVRPDGPATLVSVDPAARAGLPSAADAVLGTVARPAPVTPPPDVPVRAMTEDDWADVRRIYGEGIATRNATFEAEVPSRRTLDAKWLPDHRWVAEVGGRVAGWGAATPVSSRECYAGVAETSIYVAAHARGRGVGKAVLHRQVAAADEGGLWTLQTAIFPENRASIVLHHAAGFRTIGVRERIARHHGVWRDTVLLERRIG